MDIIPKSRFHLIYDIMTIRVLLIVDFLENIEAIPDSVNVYSTLFLISNFHFTVRNCFEKQQKL